MKDYITFNLCEHVPAGYPGFFENRELTIYEQFKRKLKVYEYRFASERNTNLLLGDNTILNPKEARVLTDYLRVRKARLVTGYPKDSLPRLEGDITSLEYLPDTQMFKIGLNNLVEVAQTDVNNPMQKEKQP